MSEKRQEPPPSVDEACAAGRMALERGAWPEARSWFEDALWHGDRPDALEGLSSAAWWLEDVVGCLDARERAYRAYRQAGDQRSAARMALWLGDDHIEFRGAEAVAEGWFRRAARLLADLEPCPEHGWLAVFEAHTALDRHDLPAARRLAAEAQTAGRRHGAVDLEMFALASEGAARIAQGDVAEGMRCLSEATAAALGGEYENLTPAAWSCCLLMSSCEQVRDYERGAQWCRKVEEFSRLMDARFVTGVCRAHYGAILTWQGSWHEAERELTEALSHLTATRPFWRAEALVRLGDLRRRQGRLAAAESLFGQAPEHPLGQRGMAALNLDRDAPMAARDLLERALRQIPVETRARRADALELLVQAEIALADHHSAAEHLEELRSIAADVATEPLRAAVCFSDGLLAAAAGQPDQACDHFEDAVDMFTRCRAPLEAGRARIELAWALLGLDRAQAAGHEARTALRDLTELGAAVECARASTVLERLGVRPATRQTPERPLTERQTQVLRLVAEGLVDKDIAARLVLSEHTVHRHIANIYSRLGCATRAAAVARANQLGLL